MILNYFCEICGSYNLYHSFILIENNGCLLNGLISVVKVLFEMAYIELTDDIFFCLYLCFANWFMSSTYVYILLLSVGMANVGALLIVAKSIINLLIVNFLSYHCQQMRLQSTMYQNIAYSMKMKVFFFPGFVLSYI